MVSWILLFTFSVFLFSKCLGCQNLSSLRSSFISSDAFNLTKVSGLWYEIAYHDLAQVGEKCQTYNKGEYRNSTLFHVEGIPEEFGFVYIDNRPSSTLNLFYETTDEIGVFNRFLDEPVANLLKFPSVIIDVTSSDGGLSYDTITEYLCFGTGGIEYEEVRIGAREPTLSSDKLQAIKDNLVSLGITASISDVDHSHCQYPKYQ